MLLFRAKSKAQSRVLLGSSEAADLEQPGRGIIYIPGRGKMEILAPMVSGKTLLEASYPGEVLRQLEPSVAGSRFLLPTAYLLSGPKIGQLFNSDSLMRMDDGETQT